MKYVIITLLAILNTGCMGWLSGVDTSRYDSTSSYNSGYNPDQVVYDSRLEETTTGTCKDPHWKTDPYTGKRYRTCGSINK